MPDEILDAGVPGGEAAQGDPGAPATPAESAPSPTPLASGEPASQPAAEKDEELEKAVVGIRDTASMGFKTLRSLAETRGAEARRLASELTAAKQAVEAANPFRFDEPPASYDAKPIVDKIKQEAGPYFDRIAQVITSENASKQLESLASNPSLLSDPQYASYAGAIAQIVSAGYARPAEEVDAIMDLTRGLPLQVVQARLAGQAPAPGYPQAVPAAAYPPSQLPIGATPPIPNLQVLDQWVENYGVEPAQAAALKAAFEQTFAAAVAAQNNSTALQAKMGTLEQQLNGFLGNQKAETEKQQIAEVDNKIGSALKVAVSKLNIPDSHAHIRDAITDRIQLALDRDPQALAIKGKILDFAKSGASNYAGGQWNLLNGWIGAKVVELSQPYVSGIPAALAAGAPKPPSAVQIPPNAGDVPPPAPDHRPVRTVEDIVSGVRGRFRDWKAARGTA